MDISDIRLAAPVPVAIASDDGLVAVKCQAIAKCDIATRYLRMQLASAVNFASSASKRIGNACVGSQELFQVAIELVSGTARLCSLSFRLFANIMAGHSILQLVS